MVNHTGSGIVHVQLTVLQMLIGSCLVQLEAKTLNLMACSKVL